MAQSPIGWASQGGGTTGGGSATAQTVTTIAALRTAVAGTTPAVVILSGSVSTGATPLTFGSNKTLIGANASATITGGVVMSGVSNVIMRNIQVKGVGQAGATAGTGPWDTCGIQNGSTHIWIDHCSFSDAGDGLLDTKQASNYITVSWCKFYYTDSGNTHRLACLISSGGGTEPGDWGFLKVTYHHNWFAALVDQRMPRLMYGISHAYNNYYSCSGNGYCIGVGSYGSMLIENNYFNGVNNPHQFMYDVYCWIVARGNVYNNCTGLKDTGKGGTVYEPGQNFEVQPFNTPPYSYTADSAANVPSIVQAGAGPQSGTVSTLNVSTTSLNVAAAASSTGTFNVTSNVGWTVASNQTWLTVSPASGSNNGTVTVTAAQNTGTSTRAATVTVAGTGVASQTVTVTQAAASTTNPPPTVSITSPTGGATFTAPASITINANATDSNGTVSSVAFYQGSTLLGTDTTAPYSFAWSNVAAGSYSLTARATDNGGAVTISSAVSITVGPVSTTLPSPWQTSDIGGVGAVGTASHINGVFTIEGAGADIWGTADEFRYVYQAANGDCEIRARVASVENTRTDAKVGVMIRESLAANSRQAMVVVTPSSGIHFQRRATTGGSSTSTSASATLTAPRWLRVVRSGSTFTAYHSADGTTWTTIGSQTITMGTSVYIGLAVTSHVDGTLCTGTFGSVTATP